MENNYTSTQIEQTLNFINVTLDNPLINTNDKHIQQLYYLISNIDDTNLLIDSIIELIRKLYQLNKYSARIFFKLNSLSNSINDVILEKLYNENILFGKFRNDNTILHSITCNKDTIYLLRQLLKFKTSLDVLNFNNDTPLLIAVDNNNYECAKLLLENYCDINCKNMNGNTPLHISIMNKYDDITKLLLQNYPDVNLKNNENETPLKLAIDNEDIELVKLLLEKGAKYDHDLFTKSIENNNMDLVKLLVNKYNDEFLIYYKQKLDELKSKNRFDNMVTIKIKENYFISFQKDDLSTLYDYIKDLDCYITFINSVSINSDYYKLNDIDKHGKSLLDYAFENKNVKLVKILIKN